MLRLCSAHAPIPSPIHTQSVSAHCDCQRRTAAGQRSPAHGFPAQSVLSIRVQRHAQRWKHVLGAHQQRNAQSAIHPAHCNNGAQNTLHLPAQVSARPCQLRTCRRAPTTQCPCCRFPSLDIQKPPSAHAWATVVKTRPPPHAGRRCALPAAHNPSCARRCHPCPDLPRHYFPAARLFFSAAAETLHRLLCTRDCGCGKPAAPFLLEHVPPHAINLHALHFSAHTPPAPTAIVRPLSPSNPGMPTDPAAPLRLATTLVQPASSLFLTSLRLASS